MQEIIIEQLMAKGLRLDSSLEVHTDEDGITVGCYAIPLNVPSNLDFGYANFVEDNSEYFEFNFDKSGKLI